MAYEMASRAGTVLLGGPADAVSARDEGDGYSYLPWVDLICAGVPCQDVSVAGKRAGLKGKRTGLFYDFARILQELRPAWFLFENVPGLLSSNKGRDFAEVQRVLMVECGYGICWRVLDSQFFGVAQRRSRLFIVGCFGKPCPAEVLFERESSAGDSQEGRGSWSRTTAEIAESPVIAIKSAQTGSNGWGFLGDGSCHTIDANTRDFVAFHGRQDPITDKRVSLPLEAGAGQCVAIAQNQRGELRTSRISPQLTCGGGKPGEGYAAVLIPDTQHKERSGELVNSAGSVDGAVRRNADDGSAADPNGVRDAASLPKGMDSPRYRALGNAVTSSVAEWIAERIKQVISEFPAEHGANETATGVE